MGKLNYIGFIHKVTEDSGSGWGVLFPDFPGLAVGGNSMSEAIDNAKTGLNFHIDGLIKHKRFIPAPKNLIEIKNDSDNKEFFDTYPKSIEFLFFYERELKRRFLTDEK